MSRLSLGIVGLPNVGKSTLFNAITDATVEAQNYPFCTIEPNVGIVNVPDARLTRLSEISGSATVIPATIKFVDIAGLVKGASKGEGLGNQFLSNIRDCSAVVHVVRCFEDNDITHVDGKINPADDIQTIELELIYADLQMAENVLAQAEKRAKTGQKDAISARDVLKRIYAHLGEGHAIRTLDLSDEDHSHLLGIHFISAKPMIYVANISEEMIGSPQDAVSAVQQHAKSQHAECVELCAKLEMELAVLSGEEKADFLAELGLSASGLDRLAQAGFSLLGLQTYLTTGEKETRAWTIQKGASAPQAAGVIHTDFETGFIRANVIGFDDFVAHNGWKGAKEKGLIRQEGKDYILQENDIVEFLFNV